MLEVEAVECRERVVCREEDDVFARVSTALLTRFDSPCGQCLHTLMEDAVKIWRIKWVVS